MNKFNLQLTWKAKLLFIAITPVVVSLCTTTTVLSALISQNQRLTYISTTAVINENKVDDNELAKHLATIILDTYPEAMNRHYIIVSMSYGYDIGIWSQWHSFSHQFIPEKIVKP